MTEIAIQENNCEKVFIDGKLDTDTVIKINEYLKSLNNKSNEEKKKNK